MSKSPEKRKIEELQRSKAYTPGRPTYTPWRRHFVWPWKPLRLFTTNSSGQKTERTKHIGFVWARVAMMPNPRLQFSLENPEKNAPNSTFKTEG